MKKLFITILILFLFLVPILLVRAGEMEELDKQISDLSRLSNDIKSANNTNKAQLDQLTKQINSIKYQVGQTEIEIANKEKEVKDGEKVLAYQKTLLNERAKSYYKNISKTSNYLINMLVAENLSESLKNFFYQKSMVDEDRKTIIKVVLYIKDLETKKNNLKTQKEKLTIIKAEIDKQSQFLAGEVAKANKAIGQLQNEITTLSAERDRLIAGRLAGLNLPKSAYTSSGGCSSDLTNGKNPGFSPKFGFFTFGVPHRVGMNQYGAKGRANDGKSAEDILKFYYSADYSTGYRQDVTIHIVGTNEYGQTFDDQWNIDEYLKHVYEVPTNWPAEALKAQAIAARSYALAYTDNGARSICPSQSCQVVKREFNDDGWKSAVDATKGIVLTSGGSPISAYFSSTAGGYTFESGSDIGSRPWTKNTQDGKGSYNNFSDVRNNAYDKDSPWFYCDWGSRSSYDGTAWLQSNEVADIVNVTMLALKDGGTIGNLYQIDKPNPAGKDTWNADQVKKELTKNGITPFNSIDSVSVSADFGSGRSTTITFSGDAGSKSFDAVSEFKTYFNQRAPSNIQIVGPLYNVER